MCPSYQGYLLELFIKSILFLTAWADKSYLAGHGQKFGTGRPTHTIEEYDGFPDPKTFFTDYVMKSKPLKMTGAAKISSSPFTSWNDDYFMSLEIPGDNLIHVETKKKENRKQETLEMHFHNFIKSYNSTEYYMVQTVPDFLGRDIRLPSPLHCDPIINNQLMDAIIWFSSGGTKSVVHTDAVENINCLYSGQKQFVLVNPELYGDKVDFDHPEGAYSSIDVDNVDYNKYPGLSEVEYEVANLTAGDCLYIPFKWIHQVRSFDRNIAINFWWATAAKQMVDFDLCKKTPDLDLTVDKVTFQGLDHIDNNIDALRDMLSGITKQNSLDLNGFIEMFAEDDQQLLDEIDKGKIYAKPLKKAFKIMDKNNNGHVEASEVADIAEQDWPVIQEHMFEFDDIANFMISGYENQKNRHDEL